MLRTMTAALVLASTYGCGSAPYTIPASYVHLVDSDGPVAIYHRAEGGLSCVDLATRSTRWTTPDVEGTDVHFSSNDLYFFVAEGEMGARTIRAFRTVDGGAVGEISGPPLADAALSDPGGQATLSTDGRHVAFVANDEDGEGAVLRVADFESGEHRDVPLDAVGAVGRPQFGHEGWLALQTPGKLLVFENGPDGFRPRHEVAAHQAWWAPPRLVYVDLEGRFGILDMDGATQATPDFEIGEDDARRLGDFAGLVRVSADGGHLWLDGGSEITLLRLSDGEVLFQTRSYGHRGNLFRGIVSTYFDASSTGVVYTATDSFEGRLTVVATDDTGRARTRSLGRLGRYHGDLPGFGNEFRWDRIIKLTPGGEYLIISDQDGTTIHLPSDFPSIDATVQPDGA